MRLHHRDSHLPNHRQRPEQMNAQRTLHTVTIHVVKFTTIHVVKFTSRISLTTRRPDAVRSPIYDEQPTLHLNLGFAECCALLE